MDVLDRMGHPSHPEEDYLERYVMKTCSEQEVTEIEEHLLICEQCRARLHSAEEWVSLMKTALPAGPNRSHIPRWRQAMSNFHVPPMAMASGLAAMVIVLLAVAVIIRQRPLEEELVRLTATRGEVASSHLAASSHLLRLQLDTTDLTEPLECQIVDSAGSPVWTQAISQTNAEVRLDHVLKAGFYWIRINSMTGEHAVLREFRVELVNH